MDEKTATFVKRARGIHGSAYDYSLVNYTNSNTKVPIRCPKHGTFNQRPSEHINRKYGCWDCGHAAARLSKRKRLAEAFEERARKAHGDKYDYSKVVYLVAKKKVEIICPDHGSFWQVPYSHTNGNGCPNCWESRKPMAKRHTTEQFIEKARAVHGDLYDYSKVEYKGNHVGVDIICLSCEGTFTQRPGNHVTGKNGCPKCSVGNSISKSETEWLDSLDVPERQYRIPLPSGKTTRVDGFDPSTNTVYSFLGSFWHADPRICPPNEVHPKIGRVNAAVHAETFDRLTALEGLGYKVVHIWELDWKEQLRPKRGNDA